MVTVNANLLVGCSKKTQNKIPQNTFIAKNILENERNHLLHTFFQKKKKKIRTASNFAKHKMFLK